MITSRSSGPGGQSVNKTETKVQLSFHIGNSIGLTDQEKERLLNKLKAKLTKDGALLISSEKSRSQLENKELAFQKLEAVLQKALKKEKRRKKTRPTKSSIEKRIKAKKATSEKKQLRKRIE